MYSFGGQIKIEGEEGETLPVGVTEHDLMHAIISPQLDSTMSRAVLKELTSKCLYIHYDGARYAFKTSPNINKLLEDESVGEDEIKGVIKGIMEKELGGKSAIIWPTQSKDINDKEPIFLISYLPFEFVYGREQENKALEYLTYYGDRPRICKNGICLAIPDKNQIEPLRRAVRYLKAIERIKERKKALNLTEQQLEQLKERERTESAARDSSIRGLYTSV